MDRKAIETLSVNAIRDSVVVSDFLDQFIADNDKEPTWDGFVYIYSDKSKKKEKLKGRLPVQIKGTENDDFSKEEISFPVSTTDLNNYLYDGGAVFFVVYIGHNGLTRQIYYAELPPIKLRVYLAEAKEQKSKSIKLKKFPTDPNEKAMIFFQCLENCQKQASFSSAQLLSLEELESQGVLEGITVPVSTVGGIDPKTALLKNEVYIYAKIKGSAIPQPIEAIPQKLTTQEMRNAQVSVGDRLFYSTVRVVQDAETVTIIFGESFSIKASKNDRTVKINYKSSDKLRTLIVDLDFLISYDSSIFTAEKATQSFDKAFLAKKAIQDYVFTDGSADKSIERKFAEDLDAADEVCVYAKLPRTFQIPTPVGNYSPDWAIAFYEGKVKHIFFIAETKGTMESLELRPIEQAKISCAKKLFNEMSTSNVVYHDVDSYQSLLNIMNSL